MSDDLSLNQDLSCELPIISSNQNEDDDEKAFAKACRQMRLGEEKTRSSVRQKFAYGSLGCAGILVFTYLLNLVFPEDWRWLSSADMKEIKDVAIAILTGVTVSIGTALFLDSKKTNTILNITHGGFLFQDAAFCFA